MHAIGLDDPTNPVDLINWNRLQLPPEIRDTVASTANFHDVTTNFDGTRIYMALYGGAGFNPVGTCANGMLIMDSSDIAKRRPNPTLKLVKWFSWCDQPTPAYGDGTSASAHTTQYVVHKNGKPYIITTDEGPALFQVNANGNCTSEPIHALSISRMKPIRRSWRRGCAKPQPASGSLQAKLLP